MDLKAAIEHIQVSAGQARTPCIIHDPSLPPHQFYLCRFNGNAVEAELVDADPRGRDYVASDLDGVVAQIAFLHRNFGDLQTVVLVGDGGIIVYFDESTRRHSTFMPLVRSPAFKAIEDQEELVKTTQADLVWTLRSRFRNAVTPAAFLPCIRSLKFKRSADGGSEVSHGRESMGRQVLGEVSGVTEIPEEVGLGCAVYENVPTLTRCEVICAVNVHVEDGTFTLEPVEGEVRRVLSEAQQKIADHLKVLLGGMATVLPCSGIAG